MVRPTTVTSDGFGQGQEDCPWLLSLLWSEQWKYKYTDADCDLTSHVHTLLNLNLTLLVKDVKGIVWVAKNVRGIASGV